MVLNIVERNVMTFSAEIPRDSNSIEGFDKLMEAVREHNRKEVLKIQEQFSVTEKFAMAIRYLRTRSRHTPELEQQLIEMAHKGEDVPNMSNWP